MDQKLKINNILLDEINDMRNNISFETLNTPYDIMHKPKLEFKNTNDLKEEELRKSELVNQFSLDSDIIKDDSISAYDVACAAQLKIEVDAVQGDLSVSGKRVQRDNYYFDYKSLSPSVYEKITGSQLSDDLDSIDYASYNNNDHDYDNVDSFYKEENEEAEQYTEFRNGKIKEGLEISNQIEKYTPKNKNNEEKNKNKRKYN